MCCGRGGRGTRRVYRHDLSCATRARHLTVPRVQVICCPTRAAHSTRVFRQLRAEPQCRAAADSRIAGGG
eukprot:4261163-Prymnesium_polylepis.1